ncbi:hypothetical protein [Actinoplanes awajinensis]|uniref:hypothetical protein n=1 Tax=Actinoplanes awajinensis TaxID=135946 RepID=UPI001E48577A|nr:hypothetical protein [Actinoplanes awajinensis]
MSRVEEASVWPDDPRWYESAAGRTADIETPHGRPDRRPAVVTSSLTSQQQAAARALTELMLRIRLVSYYPELTATIPVQQICRVAADAGNTILAASAKRGPAREHAFAELAQYWRAVPKPGPPTPIPSGPAALRYARYDGPHEDHDVRYEAPHTAGSLCDFLLVSCVPGSSGTGGAGIPLAPGWSDCAWAGSPAISRRARCARGRVSRRW